jgi:Protein of unknown function (DUF1501)
MLTVQSHPKSLCNGLTRRAVLQAAGLGLFGTSLNNLLAAEEAGAVVRPRAKSVLFLFLFGGPSQLETFDMKPDAPSGIRGPYQPRYRWLCFTMCQCALFAATFPLRIMQADDLSALRNIEISCIEDSVIHSATFQSNTQHLISNRNGIFAAFVKSRNEDYTAQNWKLVRSTDAGRSFSVVTEGVAATNPPVLETDEADNLYLCRVDWKENKSAIDCFASSDDYKTVRTLELPRVAGGKFAMGFDRSRQRICFITLDGALHRVGVAGQMLPPIKILVDGQRAVLQYPSLHFDERNDLYFCWTTVAHGRYLYHDIHVARSTDGGDHWETLSGKSPFAADDGGPADLISLQSELDVTTWLANAIPRFGKLHAIYETQSEPRRYNYVRLDTVQGHEELRITPEFGGESLRVQGLDGGLASQANKPNAPIFCVVRDAKRPRLVCLRSDDQGTTWRDWAVSTDFKSPYAIGTCREICENGTVIGTFTDAIEPSNDNFGKSKVYFFSIPTD